MKAEDWLYDHEDATKAMYVDKMGELKATGDGVVWRKKEAEMRGDWIRAVEGTIANYKAAVDNPGEKFGHIAPEKLAKITKACEELRAWLKDLEAKQASVPKTDRPVLLCADMEKKNQELSKMADEILKEPKPQPSPKEEKKDCEAKADAGVENPLETAEGPQNLD